MNKILYIGIFLISISCSNNRIQDSNELSTPGVDLTISQDNRIIPQIDLQRSTSTEEYGPSFGAFIPTEKKQFKKRQPVIGVILGPGLNRVMAHIQLLKSFRKNNIPVNIISGSGMSSFIAALYAKGTREDKIEWIFHKYFNEIKKVQPYTSTWKSKVEKYLINQQEWNTLESLKLFTLLPVFDDESKKLHYVNKGDIKNILSENINIFSNKNINFATLNIMDIKIFKDSGVDILIGVDVLGENITTTTNSPEIVQIFNKISDSIDQNKNKLDLYINMPTDNMPLDSLENLSYYVLKSLEYGQDISIKIKEIISTWQDNNSQIE